MILGIFLSKMAADIGLHFCGSQKSEVSLSNTGDLKNWPYASGSQYVSGAQIAFRARYP